MDDIYNSYIQKVKSTVNPEMMPHEIFVRAYNIIFPEQPITDEMMYDEKWVILVAIFYWFVFIIFLAMPRDFFERFSHRNNANTRSDIEND